uniref:Protein phosphatase n=1 Tax=Melanaphis sacchari TaxID=742174 RepID=A0A2H8TK18_9HEMI
MQQIVSTGRLISRALWNGFTNLAPSNSEHVNKKREPSFLYAVCGFPKESSRKHPPIKGKFGDDAWFSAKGKATDVLGVADGVGGWRHYGIDPGEFSSFLMTTCERLVSLGKVKPNKPNKLLAQSYYELLENKQPILGSSTACVVVLNKETSSIYTANIGDSGFMVVRGGHVVHRSEEQQHYFNTPYQLSVPPPAHSGQVLSDSPDSADTSDFAVENGDVILLATDGVFDNVPDHLLLKELSKVEGVRDPTKLQCAANTIAWMARILAFDRSFLSPFALSAQANGINTVGMLILLNSFYVMLSWS